MALKMDRILIFELNWLGDILFSFPFIRAIRDRYPEAYITCVVVPRYVELLAHNPWINFVHVLPDNNSITTLGEKMAFAGMLRRERYDTCFFLKTSRTKAIMAAYAGIRERIGFEGKNAYLTRVVEMPKGDVHRADQILALAGAAGIDKADGSYEYFLSHDDEEKAYNIIRSLGGGTRRRVALNPGGNWDAKRWPKENFIQLGRKLLKKFDDVEIAVTGAVKDIQLSQEIVSRIGDSSRCYTTAGRTGLNQLAAIFARSALVVSADSGPLHLASATGAKTIGLFGPTSAEITGPRGKGNNIVLQSKVDCVVPCYEQECDKEFACMKSITVDNVFDTALKELGAEAGRQ